MRRFTIATLRFAYLSQCDVMSRHFPSRLISLRFRRSISLADSCIVLFKEDRKNHIYQSVRLILVQLLNLFRHRFGAVLLASFMLGGH